MYTPPSDVRVWLNFRVRLDILPDLNGSILSPEVMRLPLEYLHSMSGGVYKFSTTVTLHVRLSVSPAVGFPALEMLTSGLQLWTESLKLREAKSALPIC